MEKSYNNNWQVTSSTNVMITLPEKNNDASNPGSEKNDLQFYGVVKDDHNRVIKEAAVTVFACYHDGTEKPLGYALSDNEGRYVVIIPGLPDYNSLDEFKVMAVKDCAGSENKVPPTGSDEHPQICLSSNCWIEKPLENSLPDHVITPIAGTSNEVSASGGSKHLAGSSAKGYHDLFKLMLNNPGKTLYELIKRS